MKKIHANFSLSQFFSPPEQ